MQGAERRPEASLVAAVVAIIDCWYGYGRWVLTGENGKVEIEWMNECPFAYYPNKEEIMCISIAIRTDSIAT